MSMDRMLAIRSGKTVYRDGTCTLKLFDEDYSAADVLHEALNQARAAQAGLPVPQIREVTCRDGRWMIAYDYIEGIPLDRAMREHPELRDAYMDRFVALQRQMHEIHAPFLGRLRDRLNRRIEDAQLDATTRYALHQRLSELAKSDLLCHGDYQPSNLVAAKNGALFIIDWPHAAQGDPCADAAETYLLLSLSDGERNASEYLKRYCGADHEKELSVLRWVPVAAASQSVGSILKEKELLLQIAKSVGRVSDMEIGRKTT